MRRYEWWGRLMALALVMLCVLALSTLTAWAAEGEREYENDESGYTALLYDEADVLSSGSERELMDIMKEVTAYGNAVFYSVVADDYASDSVARRYADAYYQSLYRSRDGLIVAIVLDSDQEGGCTLWLEAYGDVFDVINTSYASTITDNAIMKTKAKAASYGNYGYDGSRDYYGYASRAMAQALQVLEGQRIAQPMKIVTSLLLALILAVLTNFILVRFYAADRKPSHEEMLSGLSSRCKILDPRVELIRTDKRYDPPSSSGGGGGGHRGGGGGGHHGGGGHRG